MKDTEDFFEETEQFTKKQGYITDDIFPMSINVKKLYASIPSEDLQTMLAEREYPKRVIDTAFDRVKKLSREQILQKVEGTSKEKNTFVIT